MREAVLEAVLRSAEAPSEAQRARFAAFLQKNAMRKMEKKA